MAQPVTVQPSLATIQALDLPNTSTANLVPLCGSLSSEFLTPASIYLKLISQSNSKTSFLLESAATTETIGRWSFAGTNPRKILKTGPGHGPATDPLPLLEKELAESRVARIPGLALPPLTGGAIGYVGYDCVRYFEPRTARAGALQDVLGVPESLFMLFDTVVALDHFAQVVKIITYVRVAGDAGEFARRYREAEDTIRRIAQVLTGRDVPVPPQAPIRLQQEYTSNIGQAGYEAHVTRLKKHIAQGDIIQAVPSQRLARPTSLHPFNIYRKLRTVNPSPYMFFVDCGDFEIIGASPEVLVKSENGRIITHPIAGTVRRGATAAQDEALAEELRQSIKDRAEHVMLVDLARNDVNRVCDPLSTRVDRLMIVQKFSHVQHLTSEVSGVLRPDKTRFDAFRSIFPAGTVSGAPKVRAMELITELEGEKRGIYAGAVGYFGYGSVDGDKEEEGAMDTCIALRTMMTQNGVAYLQAGGGIVFDSDPYDEYEETMNKLLANMQCIASAERDHAEAQQAQAVQNDVANGTAHAKSHAGGVVPQPAL